MSSKTKLFQVRELLFPVYLPSALFTIGEGALLPIIPSSAERLGADLPTAAFITGLVMFGTVIADLPAAKIINRIGERRGMIAAAFIAAIGSLAGIFAKNLFLLGLGIFAIGVTVAIFGLARHAYITETVPFEFRARALSLLGGMFRLGTFVGPLIGALIITIAGLSGVYWMAIAASVLAGIILLTTKPEKMQDTPTSEFGVWSVAKTNRHKLATLGTASAILALARNARNIGLPLVALSIGLNPEHSSLIIGIAGALDFALFYVGGKTIDRKGRRFAAVPTLIAMGIGLTALAFSTNVNAFIIAALLLSLANALGSGLVMVIGADLSPKESRSEFLAAYRLMLDGGQAIAAPTISLLTAIASLTLGLSVIGGISFIGAWMMWRYLPHHGIK